MFDFRFWAVVWFNFRLMSPISLERYRNWVELGKSKKKSKTEGLETLRVRGQGLLSGLDTMNSEQICTPTRKSTSAKERGTHGLVLFYDSIL